MRICAGEAIAVLSQAGAVDWTVACVFGVVVVCRATDQKPLQVFVKVMECFFKKYSRQDCASYISP